LGDPNVSLRKRTVLGNPVLGEIPALKRNVLPFNESGFTAEDTNEKKGDTKIGGG